MSSRYGQVVASLLWSLLFVTACMPVGPSATTGNSAAPAAGALGGEISVLV